MSPAGCDVSRDHTRDRSLGGAASVRRDCRHRPRGQPDPDGKVTLREAIQAAQTDASVDGSNAGSGADTITFDPSLTAGGDATISLSLFDAGLDNGGFGPSAFAVSSAITIAGPGGENGITLRRDRASSAAFRLFYVKVGASLTLQNLTLSGGLAQGGSGGSGGGGGGGGGAAGLGGAIFNQGMLVVDHCTLAANTAVGGSGGVGAAPVSGRAGAGGGGVGGGGSPSGNGGGPNAGIGDGAFGGFGGGGAGGTGGTVFGAPAGPGGLGGFGGGGGSGGSGFLSGGAGGASSFGGGGGGGGAANANPGSGGAGGFGGGNGSDGMSGLAGSGGGGGGMGGAIFNEGGTLTLSDSTVSGNDARGGASGGPTGGGSAYGGGVFVHRGVATFLNDTLVDNTVTRGNGGSPGAGGAALFVFDGGASLALHINNTLLALSNVGAPVATDFTVLSTGQSLTVDGSNNLSTLSAGSIPAGVITQSADPQLDTLSDNGGPTLTHLPATTSPVVDHGGNAAAADLPTDQRGRPRIAPAGGTVDIGAVETVVATPPALAATTIGDGSAQRSQVKSMTLTFDRPVAIAPGAASLVRLNTGGSGSNDGSAPSDATGVLGAPTSEDGGVSWIYTFVAGNPFMQTSAGNPTGSLVDGIYTLTVDPSKVTANGVAMSTAPAPFTFHRLFGDINGNKVVNTQDYGLFRNAFGKTTGAAAFDPAFDFDNNGVINTVDYGQFRTRFGKTLTY